MTEQQETKPEKKKKIKGPLRFEAVIPFTVIVVATYLYFHFLFDGQMRRLLEWGGYNALGAEVNISHFETNFWQASLRIRDIQVTNSEKPTHNSFAIGDVRWNMLWDALLRGKVVINEAVIEQIEIDTPRAKPGRVKPPEPPPVEDGKPSFLKTEGQKLANQAVDQAQEQVGQDNVLSDLITLMNGSNVNEQLKKLEGSLSTQKKAQEVETFLKQKQEEWNQKMKGLPQGAEVQALNERLNKIKYKDFKSPAELQTSLKELDGVFKEADQKVKIVQKTSKDFSGDMKALEGQAKDLEVSFQADLKSLESRLRIPKIDAGSIAKSLFMGYLKPYLEKFEHYKRAVQKFMPYVPPNLLKKKGEEEDMSLQPHQRARGVSYEFGHPQSYPLFWIKKTGMSSESKNNPHAGDLSGYITDISTNQALIKKPLVATLSGNFPGMGISDFKSELTIDHRTTDHQELFAIQVGSYPLVEKTFVNSPEARIGFKKARGSLELNGGFNNDGFKFKLSNKFTQISYDVGSNNSIADDILKNVFQGISVVTLNAEGQGHLPNLPLSLSSNLAEELQRGFEKQLQAKINEAREQLKKYIDEAVGKEKVKVEAEVKKFQNQIQGEITKTSELVNKTKADVESKTHQAQRDLEDQGNKAKKEAEAKAQQARMEAEAKANREKKEAEERVKKQAEDEMKKKADDLKKKFNF